MPTLFEEIAFFISGGIFEVAENLLLVLTGCIYDSFLLILIIGLTVIFGIIARPREDQFDIVSHLSSDFVDQTFMEALRYDERIDHV